MPLLSRLLWAAMALLGTSLIIFLITNAIPADPVAAYAGPKADAETRARIRKELGLDDPLWKQYGRYVARTLHGDLGRSHVTEEQVMGAILTRLPTTFFLAAGALTVWVVVGVPLGVWTARWRGRPIDRIVLVLAMIGISLPVFWLARMLQFQLAYRGGYFPVAGIGSWTHFVLPSITLGLIGVGYYARLVHSNMVEVLSQDYIQAARAKGLSEPAMLFRHALPNALLPVLTVLALDVATLLGGVVFTETIFGLPGIGALSVQAVLNVDVPMVMGTVMFAAVAVVGANVVVDLLYRLVDPRVRAHG
jgi:peptide/nickel transport system permease protein